MQDKVVRFILDLGPRAHIGRAGWNKTAMLFVHDRVIQLISNQDFKIFHEKSPVYLSTNFTGTKSLHEYGTRDSSYSFCYS